MELLTEDEAVLALEVLPLSKVRLEEVLLLWVRIHPLSSLLLHRLASDPARQTERPSLRIQSLRARSIWHSRVQFPLCLHLLIIFTPEIEVTDPPLQPPPFTHPDKRAQTTQFESFAPCTALLCAQEANEAPFTVGLTSNESNRRTAQRLRENKRD